jgi:hypothetical protein
MYEDSGDSRLPSLPSERSKVVDSPTTSELAAERDLSDGSTGYTPESDGEMSFMGISSVYQTGKASVRTQMSQTTLDMIARAVIDDHFQSLGNNGVRTSPPGESASQTPRNGVTLSSSNSGATNSSSNKRKRTNEDNRTREEGDRGSKKPKCKSQPPRTDERIRLLACPYAKFDHERYSEQNTLVCEKDYRHCSSVYAQDMPRLKQHLYRVHLRPEFYCEVCFKDFQYGEERALHTRARTCSLKVCPFEEKMNADQQNKVKETVKGECTETTWYRVYRTLFGGPDPATPYSDGPWQQEVGRLTQRFEDDGPATYTSIILPLIDLYVPRLQEDQRAMLQIIEDLAIRELVQRLGSELGVPERSSPQLQSDQVAPASVHLLLLSAQTWSEETTSQAIQGSFALEEPSAILHPSENPFGDAQDQLMFQHVESDFSSSGEHSICQGPCLPSKILFDDMAISSQDVGTTTTEDANGNLNFDPQDWQAAMLDYDGCDQRLYQAADSSIVDGGEGKKRAR